MTDPIPEDEAERLAEIVSYAASGRAPPQYHPDWRTTREWTVKEIRLLLAIIESRDAEIAALRARNERLRKIGFALWMRPLWQP